MSCTKDARPFNLAAVFGEIVGREKRGEGGVEARTLKSRQITTHYMYVTTCTLGWEILKRCEDGSPEFLYE